MNIGQLVITKGISEKAKENVDFAKFFIKSIERYLDKDWGDTCESDKIMNDEAVKTGDDRIVALYNHELGDIFIITEWDRSVTTVLFCDEY